MVECFCFMCLCASFVTYCARLPGECACACLYDCVCALLNVCGLFDMGLRDVVCFVVVWCCMCVYDLFKKCMCADRL